MNSIPVIAVFDIGRTNKKILLFDEQYNVVFEEETVLDETSDEDGVPCEDLSRLREWVLDRFAFITSKPAWTVKGLNFSTYGASLVHLDRYGKPLTPLYSYLKPVDSKISEAFYSKFGEAPAFSVQTGSPRLDMLNSGFQLYWLKKERPDLYANIHASLHLPQYISYLFTGEYLADFTSIGCHTGLWDVQQEQYHAWLAEEKLLTILPAGLPYHTFRRIVRNNKSLVVGIGLHDSSASLLPFTLSSDVPVGILSTGTWNIMMLPGYGGRLTAQHYERDCLYYLLGPSEPVAASRIFLGNEFDQQVKNLSASFGLAPDYYRGVRYDAQLAARYRPKTQDDIIFQPVTMKGSGPFPGWAGETDNKRFETFEDAYHCLVADLAWMQGEAIKLILHPASTDQVYVTGGFAKNVLFMQALEKTMPGIRFRKSTISQGTALGAALALPR